MSFGLDDDEELQAREGPLLPSLVVGLAFDPDVRLTFDVDLESVVAEAGRDVERRWLGH